MKLISLAAKLMILALALSCASAQTPQVSTSSVPQHVQLLYYSGSNLQYICDAPVSVPVTSVQTSDASLTNVVVSSNVATATTASAHNLWIGARVKVVDTNLGGIALNGTYTVASVPSSTTYTFSTSGVTNGTYNLGITISTNSPLLSSTVWSVTVLHYTSNVLDEVYLGGASLSLNYQAVCANMATY